MREGIIRAVQNPLSEAYLEDTNSSSYASATGLLFVLVIVALSATGISLISFAP
jgi:hypothetical protein